ncbi:putative gnat family protein [Eutypa lata UCREL1]|uniref:Putative gnat family protein n=1 Tax=Eutypa lata (strain UCR-EL1) TaxID=1287681 RepID=M7T3S2_EUTLA|nr:putative gnat family protein [Eutypa lata UCREL1]
MATPDQQPLLIIRVIPASQTYPLRHAVLWPHKPPSYVQLSDDADGQHFGAFVPIGTGTSDNPSESEPISIISLFIDIKTGEARFRKFATAVPWQGKGIGSALLAHTIEAAVQAGAKSIWCDARQSALPFYEKFGMGAEGEVFFKGDVPYLRMSKGLA